jgi:hypothetical protein
MAMPRSRRHGYVAIAARNWPEGVPSSEVDSVIQVLCDSVDRENSVLHDAIIVVASAVKMRNMETQELVALDQSRARARVYVRRSTRSIGRVRIIPLWTLQRSLHAMQEGRYMAL